VPPTTSDHAPITETDTVIRTVQLTKEFEGIPAGPPGPPGVRASNARPAADEKQAGTPFRAVDRLDLGVQRGEIYGLLGPNGAGKTTTIGMLTTRVIPTSGTAEVDGVDVVAHPSEAKQVIGVVTQTNTLDRSLTVFENLFFHGRYFGLSAGAARREAYELLDQFRLAERAKTEVASLSGGMAQRLMVARAIMHRPKVLFLDEPTTGLDPQSRLALWEILHELNKAGQTVLLTTHYMEEADQLCDRVAIMDHGRILALDTPHGLKRSVDADTLATIHTAAGEEGSLEEFAEALGALEGATSAEVDQSKDSPAVRLYVRGTDGVLGRIIETGERLGVSITDVSMTETTLETVFINLTGKDLRE